MRAATLRDGVSVHGVSRHGGGDELEIFDPSTGRPLARLASGDDRDVDAAARAARAALNGEWSAIAAAVRGRLCRRVAAVLLEKCDELVDIGIRDAGLPVSLARRDVTVAARYFEFYGSVAETVGGETLPLDSTVLGMTLREPWGVCAIVLPFNFPLQLAARDLAPALAMGNTAVLKPAEQTPFGPLALVDACVEAGIPGGVVNAVAGTGAIGAELVIHPQVDHVTFTGSATTGAGVMAAAASRILPSTIELGGKSPHLVFADASLDDVVAAVVSGCMRPAGQACSAGTRVLVERPAYRDVVERLTSAIQALTVGPAHADPDVGPLASASQRDRVAAAVKLSEDEGARVIRGGRNHPSARNGGYFIVPTLIADAANDAHAVQQEIFGPVLTLQAFDTEDEGVLAVNATPYGLVAAVWTRDGARGLRVARQAQAGQVFVNGYGVGGGVELPFGGYKRSGIGRTKGVAGALEYTQLKTICVGLR